MRLSPVLLLGLLTAFPACRVPVPTEVVRSAEADAEGRLRAVLVNGGGSRARNYQSHVLHLRGLVDVLVEGGVRRDDIFIFSGNGPDPKPDLATREWFRDDDFWLLGGTDLQKALGPPIEYVRSEVEGFELRPATNEELRRWFEEEDRRLRPGDTLLFYVTDHGTAVDTDPLNNRISLWGKDEHLSVKALGDLLDGLPASVRIVLLMSQCYSGGFAHLARADGRVGTRCGYFSTTAKRLASGCYPEDRGRENVGHSFELIRALASAGGLPAAHETVLRTDHTPDVPLRASDVFLAERLRDAAEGRDQTPSELIDDLLEEAWTSPAVRENGAGLVDSVARTFGVPGPRSLADLDEQASRLRELRADADTFARAWRATLDDARRENLRRFLETHPEWRERLGLDEEKRASHSAEERAALRRPLLETLAAFTDADPAHSRRLRELRGKASIASSLGYRTQVRDAAVLRLRTLLTSLAGRVHAASTQEGQAELEKLLECEDLRLPADPPERPPAPERSPLPPLAEDVERIADVRPAWLGISFRPANESERTGGELPRGAVVVVDVAEGSPAEAAGITAGDVVLGPPGEPFAEPREIREWTMRSPPGRPLPLVILRDDRRIETAVELVHHPGSAARSPRDR